MILLHSMVVYLPTDALRVGDVYGSNTHELFCTSDGAYGASYSLSDMTGDAM